MFNRQIRLLYCLIFIILLEFSTLKEINQSQKDLEKIKKGLFMDSYMLSQNQLFYNSSHPKDMEKEKEKEKKLKRKLEENEITLKDVGFFAYEIGSTTESIRSYKNIFNNIDRDRSKYILYPYAFKYNKKNEDGTIEEKEQNKGGFFSLNQNLLPNPTNNPYFENIKNISTVEISKSKALYDIDIGILTYETKLNGIPINLYSEADLICTFFA